MHRNALQGLLNLATILCWIVRPEPAFAGFHNGLHFDTRPQPGLPLSHPEQSSQGAVGLPAGCLTYAERHGRAKNYTERRGHNWNPNALYPNSKYVLLVRVHNGLPYPTDLLLHLRALMEEVSEVGIHIFLLYQADRPPGDPGTLDIPKEAAFMDALVPPELIPITFVFSQQQIHSAYPLVHSFVPHERDYLPVVWFMHGFQQYRFCWTMEYDVRYTGGHWGHFLNSVLNLAASKLSDKPLTPEEQEYMGNNHALPAPETKLPDFLGFGEFVLSAPINWTDGPYMWYPRDKTNWQFTHMTTWGVIEAGFSRHLMTRLHELSLAGQAGYIEEFVPTACYPTDPLCELVVVPVPQYGGPSHHCCKNVARDIYRQWYTSGECRAHALLHPVKLFSHEHHPTAS